MTRIALTGCRADTLGGYLQALGLLRMLSAQRDATARLHWKTGDIPVLTTESTAEELVAWLVEEYRPSSIVDPWNAGSGFAANGKSKGAEKILDEFRTSAEPRFAPLREAIEAADRVVAEGRRQGWEGKSFWGDAHKAGIILLCRQELPEDALAWLDVAVTLTRGDLKFNPLTGTGGNFGRQDLVVTFLSRLSTAAGPDASPKSREWAEAALFGREDVPYLRDTVGQYDPGRAGGIHAAADERADGLANPWATILTLEGTLPFASAVTRRFGAMTEDSALPFATRTSTVGYDSAAVGETVKGEQWMPLWSRPASAAEIAHLMGEGRAQWRGRQARTGLEFAMAVAALGVDRGISAFRRFMIAERLGQNPLAVPVGRLRVDRRPDERLVREPYDWVQRLRRISLPTAVATAARRVEHALYGVATGDGGQALRHFVVEFGRLHAAVARSGAVRARISPYVPPRRPVDWLAALPYDDELWVAAGFATLRDESGEGSLNDGDRSVRALLTRVVRQRSRKGRVEHHWTDQPATGLELNGATLARALAEAHRLRVIGAKRAAGDRDDAERPAPRSVYPLGQWVRVELVERYVRGELDDELIADYLNGLLALGCRSATEAAWPPVERREPMALALAALLPFYGTSPVPVWPLMGTDRDEPEPVGASPGARSKPIEANPVPRPEWIARLVASGVAGIADDVLLRLRLAECPPVVPAKALEPRGVDGARFAGALLLRVPGDTTVRSSATRPTYASGPESDDAGRYRADVATDGRIPDAPRGRGTARGFALAAICAVRPEPSQRNDHSEGVST